MAERLYDIIDAGGNVLNLDGPLEESAARALADEISADGRECWPREAAYELHYAHPTHGSDKLNWVCFSPDGAARDIFRIKKQPERYGFFAWLRDSIVWATNSRGDVVASS